MTEQAGDILPEKDGEIPASNAAAAPAPAAPLPATSSELREPGGLTNNQRRASAKDDHAEKEKKSRIGFNDLPPGQQGFITALLKLFGALFNVGLSDKEMLLTLGIDPEEYEKKRATHSSEEIAQTASLPADRRDRDRVMANLADRLRGITGMENREGGVVLKRPVADNIRETSEYGMRHLFGKHSHHDGLDYGARNNTPIQAPADGRVFYAGPASGYGNIIILEHGHGVYTLYGHLDKNDIAMVRKNQEVQAGEAFTRTGTSGSGTGAHLHYEVLVAQPGGPPVNIDPALAEGKDLTVPEIRDVLMADAKVSARHEHDVETKVAALQHIFAADAPKVG